MRKKQTHKKQMHFFLERIRSFRKEARLTQQNIARQLGINQATYSAMERGSQRLYADYLPKIAGALGIPIWRIFIDPEERGELSADTRGFLEMWKTFDPLERSLLRTMAEQIMRKKELEIQGSEAEKNEDPPVEAPRYKKGFKSA